MSGSDVVEAKDSGEKKTGEKREETTTITSNQIKLDDTSFNTSDQISFEEIETKHGLVPKAFVALFDYVNQYYSHRTVNLQGQYQRLFVLSGAVGVGKSTVLYWLDKLQSMPGFKRENAIGIAREPWVDDSLNVKKYDLKSFYDDPTKHAARFQFDVLLYYTNISINLTKPDTWKNHNKIIVERSPYDVIEVFLPVWKWAMPEAHYTYLLGIASTLCKFGVWEDAFYFYINTSEEKMLQRVHERKRDAEANLHNVRLEQIHDTYQKFVGGKWPHFRVFENHDYKDLLQIVTYFLTFELKFLQ